MYNPLIYREKVDNCKGIGKIVEGIGKLGKGIGKIVKGIGKIGKALFEDEWLEELHSTVPKRYTYRIFKSNR